MPPNRLASALEASLCLLKRASFSLSLSMEHSSLGYKKAAPATLLQAKDCSQVPQVWQLSRMFCREKQNNILDSYENSEFLSLYLAEHFHSPLQPIPEAYSWAMSMFNVQKIPPMRSAHCKVVVVIDWCGCYLDRLWKSKHGPCFWSSEWGMQAADLDLSAQEAGIVLRYWASTPDSQAGLQMSTDHEICRLESNGSQVDVPHYIFQLHRFFLGIQMSYLNSSNISVPHL